MQHVTLQHAPSIRNNPLHSS